MKFFRNFIIICLLGLLYSSCAKKENYPDVPAITFNSFAAYDYTKYTNDSDILTLNFTDGNGDIGYPSSETNPPHDLYVLPLIWDYRSKSYQPWILNNDTFTFPYNIPYITPVGNDKELSGLIKVNMGYFLYQNIVNDFTPGMIDTLADPYNMIFKVWIYDRAGNKSNVLVTPAQKP